MSTAEAMEPLEEKKIDSVDETGRRVSISVLDAVWSKDMDFLPYCSPLCSSVEPTSGGTGWIDPVWTEAMGWLDNDLQQLLEMDYHKFWCQVMHDASLQKAIDSYLQHGPRPFDRAIALPNEVLEQVKSVHRRVFAVLLRLSTHKESPENFMSPDFYAQTIYGNHLFDIPKLLDFCAIYGEVNKELVSKMVANIFKKQPRYEEDWGKMVGVVLEELSSICERVTSTDHEALRLASHDRFSAGDFSNLVLHLADFAATLRSFLAIYSPAVRELIRARFMERVVEFYEAVVPRLQENWYRVKGNLKDALYVKRRLRSLKADLAWLVHECLQVWYLSPPPVDSSGVRSKVSMDGFITVLSDMAGEPNFLREYRKCYDVVEEIRTVQRTHPEMPEDQFDYLVSALEQEPPISSKETGAPQDPPPSPRREKKHGNVDETVTDSLVSQVKDLLPHLGAGFIKICLREFGNDPEAVINSVLEDNLPPHLKGLDFSLASDETLGPLPQPGVQAVSDQAESLVDKRECVYDGDEFDLFRRPGMVDLSRVHIGKKFDPITAASVLDDKSHLLETRDRYSGYQVETKYDYVSEDQACRLEMDGDCGELTAHVPGLDIMYEDEYDDTYDSLNVGAADDATDEQFVVKRLNKKGLFGRKLYEEEEEVNVEKKPILQHPIILKRPDLSGERSDEQLHALQSIKSLMHNISEQNKHGRDVRDNAGGGKDKQESLKASSKEGGDWRRKGDKAKWRARDREEEGGVVEVRTSDRRGGGGRGQDGWRSTTRGKEGKSLEVGSAESRQRGGQRQGGSRDRHGGGHKDVSPSGRSKDEDGVGAFKENDQLVDHHPTRSKRPPGGALMEGSPPLVKGGETSSECQERTSQAGRKREEGSGQSASSSKHGELRARQIKDRNKSSRANHNRKNLADKKRRGGMM